MERFYIMAKRSTPLDLGGGHYCYTTPCRRHGVEETHNDSDNVTVVESAVKTFIPDATRPDYVNQVEKKLSEIKQAVSLLKDANKASDIYIKEAFAKNGISSSQISGYSLISEEKEARAKLVGRLKELYVENGTTPIMASWLTKDLDSFESVEKVPVRKYSKYDNNIYEKTMNTRKAAAEDTVFQQYLAENKEAARKLKTYYTISRNAKEVKVDYVKKDPRRAFLIRYPASVVDFSLASEEQKLETALLWEKAGIPSGAQRLDPYRESLKGKLSIPSVGKIDNVWVVRNGVVKKIAGYKYNEEQGYGRPVHYLITEDGEKVTAVTHYYNYTSSHDDVYLVVNPHAEYIKPIDVSIAAVFDTSG